MSVVVMADAGNDAVSAAKLHLHIVVTGLELDFHFTRRPAVCVVHPIPLGGTPGHHLGQAVAGTSSDDGAAGAGDHSGLGRRLCHCRLGRRRPARLGRLGGRRARCERSGDLLLVERAGRGAEDASTNEGDGGKGDGGRQGGRAEPAHHDEGDPLAPVTISHASEYGPATVNVRIRAPQHAAARRLAAVLVG